ncbi:hypothetical protein O3S81_26225 [Agrobacterium sp. SOY23]|uniref:hypothetical protein n=1 Tax=Agrobacterium sp. SOY23 TaxID=3014555 RepID=UPI0022B046B7|nr:hypothetical protein [Agrobacterium sp. SOY23]MCZ4433207.1 hypothetical protein [Agrobacterium sp. SOY23]
MAIRREDIGPVLQPCPPWWRISVRHRRSRDRCSWNIGREGLILSPLVIPGFTDSAALKDPDAVWGRLLRASFSTIQTDEMAALRSYLETNKFAAAGKAKTAV